MARRNRKRGRAKLEPAVETMLFNLAGQGSHTIDLSQNACLLNRRFYRQGLNWAVAGFTFVTQAEKTGTISVAKVPDTWVTRNSWVKGFKVWQELNKQALETTESVESRYTDFKVYMDKVHHAAGSGANAIAMMGDPATALTKGDWDYSVFAVQDSSSATGATDEREAIWVGANYPYTL